MAHLLNVSLISIFFVLSVFADENARDSVIDHGVYGELFEISEVNMIDVLHRRLNALKESGKLADFQKEIQEKARKNWFAYNDMRDVPDKNRDPGLKQNLEHQNFCKALRCTSSPFPISTERWLCAFLANLVGTLNL
jgi:hypothetical protein